MPASGRRSCIDRGNGFFEPRQVQIGERDGDRIQVLSGLSGGERVVTSGNFLIDSESQMKAAAAGMGGMAGMPGMTNEPMGKTAKPAEKQRTLCARAGGVLRRLENA